MQTLNSVAQPTAALTPPTDFLTLAGVTKVYDTARGPFPVLDGIDLAVAEGEFVSIIGHSGCGKSTLLNMVAGFTKPTAGEIRLQSRLITKPGPDRMVVFQNYSLLPWLSVHDNVDLAVKSVYPDLSKAKRREVVAEHLEMVGLTEAARKKPRQISGGMRQRVAIARALAIRPQVLILDEPFGALDPITREELQDKLLEIWREHRLTVLAITHEIDEAIYLSDRIVMMTNGPGAKIGEIVPVPFPRPRNRVAIAEDPNYYTLRNHLLDFLYHRFALHDED